MNWQYSPLTIHHCQPFYSIKHFTMIKIILPILAMLFGTNSFSQNTLLITVKDSAENKTLGGATIKIKGTNI